MSSFLAAFLEQAQQQSWAEVIAVFFSLLYPYLAARQSIWCWLCALISTSLYVYLLWNVGLHFNSLLNVYYVLMAIYGWNKWRKDDEGEVIHVTAYPLLYHVVAIAALLVISFALCLLVTFSWMSLSLYLDVLVSVFSVYATYLMANKILENWLFWLVINIAAAYLYFMNGLFLTAIMFVGYFFMAVYGYFSWKLDYEKQAQVA